MNSFNSADSELSPIDLGVSSVEIALLDMDGMVFDYEYHASRNIISSKKNLLSYIHGSFKNELCRLLNEWSL